MAMSLEDLLAEEGFKSGSAKRMTRASSGASTRIPPHPLRDEHKFGIPSRLRKTERAYSDTHRYDMRAESPETDKVMRRRSVEVLKRGKMNRYSAEASQQFSSDEIVEVREGIRKVKDEMVDNRRYKDIYLNGVFSPPISKNKQYNEVGEDLQIDNDYATDYQKGGNRPGSSSSRSNRSTQNKESVRDNRARRPVEIDSVTEVALDEVAIKAMISILSGYVKKYLKDQDFRTSMYHNCFAALNFSKLEEEIVTESKVISNLEQAIETVEKAAENLADAKQLKKASLQLSVITGLNANDLKDGFTSGFPNSVLSACGHLYLSVIYQLQKKERIVAKHLLQMFCDSPFSARTTLVPELWENVFHPHLSHLESWYNQEVNSLADDPHNTRKLKQLKKVYYDILDSGTYQFALYYKDWITDGVEAPSIPSIHVPMVSVQKVLSVGVNGNALDFGSPSFSSHAIVSKKLYDDVFGQMHKSVTAEVEDYQYSQRSEDDTYSFDGSVVEDKRTLTYPLEEDEYKDLDVKRDRETFQQGEIIAQEELELQRANTFEGLEGTNMLQSLPVAKVNELTLKRLAKFVFGLQQTENQLHLDVTKHPDSSPIKSNADGEHFFLNIPEDYMCPLTGHIFEDPVTLETGQTYERVAIMEWFSKGNNTCPVTGKTLEYQTVPFTNSILKRLIDSWKSKHSREMLSSASRPMGSPREHEYKAEAAVFILEQLLTVFGREENTANAKHLLALGGLQFLIQRFRYGNLDEKTRVAALLSMCIEADSSYRNHVARHVDKEGVLELLHCKEVKSRSNAVFLLFDLICLNRRKDVRFFLSGLQKEVIVSSMHILLLFLQSCSLEQKPSVAVLLLHLDLLVDQQKYSIYREEAVDTITSALDTSIFDEKVRETCCRALLIMGARISLSGTVITQDYILQKAGFYNRPKSDVISQPELDVLEYNATNILTDTEEEEAVEDWLIRMSTSLVSDGKKSFLDSFSQCLSCGHREMTKVCLITMVWFSSSLASLPESEFQLSAFSVLISKLKENLENSAWVEHKILAATSLLNFTKIPECMNIMLTMANEIAAPLSELLEESWTAKELYALISQED
ncbi:putative U box domain, armadillo-like helical, Zinc finger, RING/FYVE/PHD-type [Helianthus annuus]|nr:putative U box domain, armadillo-like helical, Zinc finger, RING/FYVE/PHD-type [Helianthus annuus]